MVFWVWTQLLLLLLLLLVAAAHRIAAAHDTQNGMLRILTGSTVQSRNISLTVTVGGIDKSSWPSESADRFQTDLGNALAKTLELDPIYVTYATWHDNHHYWDHSHSAQSYWHEENNMDYNINAPFDIMASALIASNSSLSICSNTSTDQFAAMAQFQLCALNGKVLNNLLKLIVGNDTSLSAAIFGNIIVTDCPTVVPADSENWSPWPPKSKLTTGISYASIIGIIVTLGLTVLSCLCCRCRCHQSCRCCYSSSKVGILTTSGINNAYSVAAVSTRVSASVRGTENRSVIPTADAVIIRGDNLDEGDMALVDLDETDAPVAVPI
jgi:hypothetical protein